MQFVLKRDQYDPFIDFLKAYSIICVVLAHCLPPILCDYSAFAVWGSAQVPLFLLIQVFHVYKKDDKTSVNIRKLFARIILPFIILQIFIIGLFCLISSDSVLYVVNKAIVGGGKGPGSYYFWIYLQFAFLLPLLRGLLKRITMRDCYLFFIAICIGFDVLCSLIDLPEELYRLLAIRYLFLICLSMEWIRQGICLNVKKTLLSIFSISVVLYFYYFNPDLEPFIFNTNWAIHRWMCYFYISSLLVMLLRIIYKKIIRFNKIRELFLEFGRSSYEIYLIQMAVFTFVPIATDELIDNSYVKFACTFLLEITLSITLGIALRRHVMVPLLNRNK